MVGPGRSAKTVGADLVELLSKGHRARNRHWPTRPLRPWPIQRRDLHRPLLVPNGGCPSPDLCQGSMMARWKLLIRREGKGRQVSRRLSR
jgi:hypothetical protein